jgi:hypothetical protein
MTKGRKTKAEYREENKELLERLHYSDGRLMARIDEVNVLRQTLKATKANLAQQKEQAEYHAGRAEAYETALEMVTGTSEDRARAGRIQMEARPIVANYIKSTTAELADD